jgi:hypothetical protein
MIPGGVHKSKYSTLRFDPVEVPFFFVVNRVQLQVRFYLSRRPRSYGHRRNLAASLYCTRIYSQSLLFFRPSKFQLLAFCPVPEQTQ